MTDEELEDEIFKALMNGDAKLIPASELGIDESVFQNEQNVRKMHDALYDSYCAMCHSITEVPDKAIERYLPVDSLDKDVLSCSGQYGMLKWYSMTLFFDESIHKMDAQKQSYNDYHDETAGDEFFEGPREHLAKAINNNGDFINLLRNPFVVNSSELIVDDSIDIINQMYLETSLKNFMGNDIFSDTSLKYNDRNGIFVTNKETIKSKDVVIPYLICNQKSLQTLAKAAKVIMECGANCVALLFVTRLVPSKDGKEVPNLSEGHAIASFAPRFGVNLGNILK